MNDWERETGARVKTVRESIRWSQSAFAGQLGITKDQLASVEYGRTPLRYDIAWRLRQTFGISLRWLEAGFSFPDAFELDGLPTPAATGLPVRALLSEVVRKFQSTAAPAPKVIRPQAKEAPELVTEAMYRASSEALLKARIEEWIARLPDGRVPCFTEQISAVGEALVVSFPKEPVGVVQRRREEIMWQRMRVTNARKMLDAAALQKKMLTGAAISGTMPSVKSQVDNLVVTLNRLTGKRGKKTELARFLGAPLASVSRWLSGDRVPGADTTLSMLTWVKQQERK